MSCNMDLSQNGLDLIKEFEGLKLTAYKALKTEKYYTIGYGHYGSDVKEGQKITKAQAESLLKKDVTRFVDAVNEGVKTELNQNQFDALVSFTYNVGESAFKKSTLLEKLNKRDFEGAVKEFARWNKSGGKVIQGLINRRKKEQALFSKETVVKQSTPKVEYITHTVKLGETLSGIAHRYGSTVGEIAKLNKIPNPNVIYAGRKVRIPKR
jgi:GH24 family phage-related lysozyme (muramidase)